MNIEDLTNIGILTLLFIAVYLFFYNKHGGKKHATLSEEIGEEVNENINEGEKRVRQILSNLPSSEYIKIHNIILPHTTGTSQIDHIVLSSGGIMVIETKCYHGVICGNENDTEWEQYLGNNKYKFFNPFIQNEGHIKTLKYLLNKKFGPLPYVNIIAFNEEAFLKINLNENEPSGCLVYYHNLPDVIQEFQGKLEWQTLISIKNVLEKLAIKNEEAHITYVKKYLKEKKGL